MDESFESLIRNLKKKQIRISKQIEERFQSCAEVLNDKIEEELEKV